MKLTPNEFERFITEPWITKRFFRSHYALNWIVSFFGVAGLVYLWMRETYLFSSELSLAIAGLTFLGFYLIWYKLRYRQLHNSREYQEHLYTQLRMIGSGEKKITSEFDNPPSLEEIRQRADKRYEILSGSRRAAPEVKSKEVTA